MGTYNRYSNFKTNGTIKVVPFIVIPKKATDYYEVYQRNITRLDLLSSKYYDNPNYDWLILQANPQYGSMEFLIPDGTMIRIPYPLGNTITQYNNDIENYKNQNEY